MKQWRDGRVRWSAWLGVLVEVAKALICPLVDSLLIAVNLLLLVFEPRPKGFRHPAFVVVRVHFEDEQVAAACSERLKTLLPDWDAASGENKVASIRIAKPISSEIELLLDLLVRNASPWLNENVQ